MAPTSVFVLFDDRMALHRPLGWPGLKGGWPLSPDDIPDGYTFENPQRIRHMYQRLMESEQVLCNCSAVGEKRFHRLTCRPAKRETILLAHSTVHFEKLLNTLDMSEEELDQLSEEDEDVYFCHSTFMAASLACGGVVQCVDAVTGTSDTEGITRAIAIVRPPGHHACQGKAMGFCYFNSVVVAAKHAIDTGRASRVLILDWDVHHGNGSQDLTYDDPNIMYVSLHRFEHNFFPGTGRHDETGSDKAQGTNINVPWACGAGNVEYAAAFCELILPAIAAFQPELIIVSCGFDAARGDLLGDCDLTPDMYHAMTRSILETAGLQTPIVVALEGGYNIDVIAKCMEAVAFALLDEDWVETSNNETPDVNSENDVPNDFASSLLKQVATKAQPTPLPGDTKEEVVQGDDSAARLQKGRGELFRYWNSQAEEGLQRGGMSRRLARCLNNTIDALKQTPLWRDEQSFRKVTYTMCATPQKPPQNLTRTRSGTRRAQKERELEDLDSAFQSLEL